MAEILSNKQLVDVRSKLRRHGHARFPLLRADIDDLAAQAVADLWKYLNERPPEPLLDSDAVLRIAYAIFNRRAADLYRKSAVDLGTAIELPAADERVDDTAADPAKTSQYRRMLAICIAELADVSQEDQMILAVASGLAWRQGDTLTPAERQRLHRLRRRLAAAIERVLGDDAYRMLRDVS